MTLQDLFDELLDKRTFTVRLGSRQQAESLRVQLVVKWGKYKVSMDACGFLAEDLQDCSMCMTTGKGEQAGTYTFLLQPKRRSVVSYELVGAEAAAEAVAVEVTPNTGAEE